MLTRWPLVDTFQGNESDIAIFDMVRTKCAGFKVCYLTNGRTHGWNWDRVDNPWSQICVPIPASMITTAWKEKLGLIWEIVMLSCHFPIFASIRPKMSSAISLAVPHISLYRGPPLLPKGDKWSSLNSSLTSSSRDFWIDVQHAIKWKGGGILNPERPTNATFGLFNDQIQSIKSVLIVSGVYSLCVFPCPSKPRWALSTWLFPMPSPFHLEISSEKAQSRTTLTRG